MAEGNSLLGGEVNLHSYSYSKNVNGDEFGGSDPIYIPTGANDIKFVTPSDAARRTIRLQSILSYFRFVAAW